MASSTTMPPAATNPSKVTPAPSILKPRGLEPPIRRVLAVDAGSRCIRLLLLESHFGKLRLRAAGGAGPAGGRPGFRRRTQSAPAGHGCRLGPATARAGAAATNRRLADCGPAARARCRSPPTHRSGNPQTWRRERKRDGLRFHPRADPRRRIARASGSPFVRKSEIQSRIAQLGLDDQEFREITTAANALLTAWHAARPGQRDAVLVHAGAQNTTLVVIRNGVGVFASSFPMAGDFFTRAIARLVRGTPQAAEGLKRSTNLLAGEKALSGFRGNRGRLGGGIETAIERMARAVVRPPRVT